MNKTILLFATFVIILVGCNKSSELSIESTGKKKNTTHVLASETGRSISELQEEFNITSVKDDQGKIEYYFLSSERILYKLSVENDLFEKIENVIDSASIPDGEQEQGE